MDVVLQCCVDRDICVPLLDILLFCEDKDDRILSDLLLLWIHNNVLHGLGNSLRRSWLLRI